MSTLKTNNIKEVTSGGGKVNFNNLWVNFNGTGTIAIRDDANVTSLSDRGTGKYTVNYSVTFPSVNYSIVDTSASVYQNTAISSYMASNSGPASTTTGYLSYGTEYEGNVIFGDAQYLSFLVAGNLE